MTQPYEGANPNTGANPDILAGLFQVPIDDAILDGYQMALDSRERLHTIRAEFNKVTTSANPLHHLPEVDRVSEALDEALDVSDKLIDTFRKVIKQGHIGVFTDAPVLNENILRQGELVRQIEKDISAASQALISSRLG